jgi:hypothetical protein
MIDEKMFSVLVKTTSLIFYIGSCNEVADTESAGERGRALHTTTFAVIFKDLFPGFKMLRSISKMGARDACAVDPRLLCSSVKLNNNQCSWYTSY